MRVTIDEIDNGFLVDFYEKVGHTKRKGYQVHTTNNQLELMVKDILRAFAIKNYRLVKEEDAVKIYRNKGE